METETKIKQKRGFACMSPEARSAISRKGNKKLRELGVRNGAEMVAALEVTKSLESEIEGLKSQITMLTNILAQTGKAVEV